MILAFTATVVAGVLLWRHLASTTRPAAAVAVVIDEPRDGIPPSRS